VSEQPKDLELVCGSTDLRVQTFAKRIIQTFHPALASDLG